MKKSQSGLSAWHLSMMAVGTVIGGSFFLGSSIAIEAAGPSILISYILGGVLIYFILYALSEMTVANPDAGSFRTFAAGAFGNGAGFVVGWIYWTGMVLAMSSEATAASILIREWYPNLPISAMASGIIIGVTLLNLLGADKLSRLESGLAALKLLAIASFIIIAVMLILGLFRETAPIGIGEVAREPLMPGGIRSIAGSMLIVIFAYAGFEIIGLAASETADPHKTVPRAINYTIIMLIFFYILSVSVMLPLIPTAELSEDVSPFVAALERWGMTWAGTAVNIILITAILSTMLAAMFGLGRMMRSLADEKQAPSWLIDKKDVPYRGIIFSGAAMLLGVGAGLLFPRVYLFLISSGGFALLFTYTVILATHIRFRSKYGCPPKGKCQMPWFPYSSWSVLVIMILIILSMPFISGQTSGLVAGVCMTLFFTVCYFIQKRFPSKSGNAGKTISRPGFSSEYGQELMDAPDRNDLNDKNNKNGRCD
ncbi:MAG TPA: amino acid permease [Anaerovoracaceae bacterium]|nr:amino acid permease [Anaerovoracaceae bacterium]